MFDDFFRLLLLVTLAGSISCLVLLVCKRPLLKTCGGRLNYYLWLIPLLFFLLPVQADAVPFLNQLKPSSFSAAEEITALPQETAQQEDTAVPPPAQNGQDTADGIPATKIPVDYSLWFFAVWTAGTFFLLFRCLYTYLQYQRRLTHYGCWPVAEEAKLRLEQVKAEMGIKREVRLYSSLNTTSPLLMGFFQPKIILPCQEMTGQEYLLIFRHELTHYRHGDIWYKFLAAAANAAQWFNPLSYLMVRNINENCEYACDETVTRYLEPGQRRLYSEMILKMLSFHALAPAFVSHLSKNKKILKRRFDFIMEPKKHKRIIAAVAAVFLLAISAFLPSLALAEEKQFSETTYYNPYYDWEQNIRLTLRILPDDGSIVVWVNSNGTYLDRDGFDTVYPNDDNLETPVLFVTTEWRAKTAAPSDGEVTRQYSIEGNDLTVAFSAETAAYRDNPVIDKMIRNRFAHELHYVEPLGATRPEYLYDHPGFIRQVMERGVFCITFVAEPEEFPPISEWRVGSGGTMSYLVQSEANRIDPAYWIWEETIALEHNVDGTQGRKFGQDFTIPAGKTLAIDLEDASESMRKVNIAVVDLSTGQTVDWMPSVSIGTRLTYTPGNAAGGQFKIMLSTDELYGGEAELSAYVY